MGKQTQELGEPHLFIGGLRLWVHAREFPEATDYWDGNWLNVTAQCKYPGSSVSMHGPFVRTDEIERFVNACSHLHQTLAGEAKLETLEPYLKVCLTGNGRGQVNASFFITSDHLNQKHTFLDELDQTHLPPLIAGCERLLRQYPVIDRPAT